MSDVTRYPCCVHCESDVEKLAHRDEPRHVIPCTRDECRQGVIEVEALIEAKASPISRDTLVNAAYGREHVFPTPGGECYFCGVMEADAENERCASGRADS